jgi:hypothetical protein
LEDQLKKIIVLIATCSLVLSCASVQTPVDRGVIDVDQINDQDLAKLNINEYINIDTIDGKKVNWVNPNQSIRKQFVKMSSGVHAFSVRYNDGNLRSIFPQTVIGKFEKGGDYLIEGDVSNGFLKILIVDSITKNDVSLDLNKLKGDDSSTISSYIKYVLNPTMEENNKTIQLENDQIKLLYKPNMTYSLLDKRSNITTEGYRGFITDMTMKSGKVYLLETDVAKMTKDDFLNTSDYENKAQVILIPVKCSEKSVTYKYLKPEALKDTEIIFVIKEI